MANLTRIDQLDLLFSARYSDSDMGFVGRSLALCCLPRTNPGGLFQYERVNGPYTLYMIAGGGCKLPYGNLPRLLLAWVATEAVKTQSRDLVLGASLSEFMRELGVYNSGGGLHRRVRDQMERLFSTQISLVYQADAGRVRSSSLITDHAEFWWSLKDPDAPAFWSSWIRLSENFFNDIMSAPVPIDLHVLRALKRSTLGLDLYLWLTYRTFSLKSPMRLSWRKLYRQFGANPAKVTDKLIVNDFRNKCLRELKKIKVAWPDLIYSTARGVLILFPSKPAIAPTTTRGKKHSHPFHQTFEQRS